MSHALHLCSYLPAMASLGFERKMAFSPPSHL